MKDNRQPLPPEAAPLGTLQAEFRPSRFRFLFLVVWGNIAVVFALALLINVAVIFLSSQPGNRPGVQRPSYEILVLVAAGVGYLSVYVLRSARQRRGGRVLVMTEGLVEVWDGRVTAVRWDDILRIWRREEPGVGWFADRCYLRLELEDGQNLFFANSGLLLPWMVLPSARLAELRTHIERETNLRRLPVLLEALSAGQTLTFDQLAVNQAGVTWQGQTWSWEQIFHLEIGHTAFLRQGQLRWALVLLGGRQVRFRMDEVPNLALLWALIEIVRADSFAPRKEWHSQPHQATPHAADADHHAQSRNGPGISAPQEPGPVTEL